MMRQPLPPLINALLDPARYPDPAQQVELIETHASWLLLAGDYVYKIKKPVVLPFLDYGTLEQRRVCCEAELRLNRRFAPRRSTWQSLPIVGSPENPQIGGTGTAIEFAVRMRRFAEAGRLDHLCRRGQLQARQISELAATLAEFHERADIGTPIDTLRRTGTGTGSQHSRTLTNC
jgi:aminoglycoside phosphotransferase family enzyme